MMPRVHVTGQVWLAQARQLQVIAGEFGFEVVPEGPGRVPTPRKAGDVCLYHLGFGDTLGRPGPYVGAIVSDVWDNLRVIVATEPRISPEEFKVYAVLSDMLGGRLYPFVTAEAVPMLLRATLVEAGGQRE